MTILVADKFLEEGESPESGGELQNGIEERREELGGGLGFSGQFYEDLERDVKEGKYPQLSRTTQGYLGKKRSSIYTSLG